MYTIGAIRNAELAKSFYPGWHVVVYHDYTVPTNVLKELSALGVQLIDMTGHPIYGLFWRFLAADLPDCAYVIFRDSDSRLTLREKKAVDEWVDSGNILHVMRDHPFHQIPFGAEGLGILGGMWGIKGGVIEMSALIEAFVKEKPNQYGVDQDFLQQLYIRFLDSQTVHDEFFEHKPFPMKRDGFRFVGERIDENEQPIGEDREVLKQHVNRQKPPLFKRIRNFIRR